jgi:hypothetical protein
MQRSGESDVEQLLHLSSILQPFNGVDSDGLTNAHDSTSLTLTQRITVHESSLASVRGSNVNVHDTTVDGHDGVMGSDAMMWTNRNMMPTSQSFLWHLNFMDLDLDLGSNEDFWLQKYTWQHRTKSIYNSHNFKHNHRELPRTLTIYDIDLPIPEAEKAIRDKFNEYSGVQDPRVVNMVVEMGYMDLEEALFQHTQRSHLLRSLSHNNVEMGGSARKRLGVDSTINE